MDASKTVCRSPEGDLDPQVGSAKVQDMSSGMPIMYRSRFLTVSSNTDRGTPPACSTQPA